MKALSERQLQNCMDLANDKKASKKALGEKIKLLVRQVDKLQTELSRAGSNEYQ
jgi:polyhydroxyalkanoate synthesis regulator phasin